MAASEQAPADPRDITVEEVSYELPEDRIAQYPLAGRDDAKLLTYAGGRIEDHLFRDLPGLLPANTQLVLNDTRVVHARIRFRRATGAAIECMVLSPADGRPMEQALNDRGSSRWWCMLGNAKRWKGEDLAVESQGFRLCMAGEDQRDGEHLIAFRWEGTGPFLQQLEHFGAVPLPPYMRRAAVEEDDARYNTVFAERPGSVAAPTASLHFTPQVLQALEKRGIGNARVTLHVGAGTFLPVKSPTMRGHAMHSEQVRIPRTAVEQLLAHLGHGPIVPVGTTALRTIESLYWFGASLVLGHRADRLAVGQWQPYQAKEAVPAPLALQAVLAWLDEKQMEAVEGNTTLLIAPGYRFGLADGLVTNFHQPRSTLLLLVAALVGPQWRTVYHHALHNGYRFLSYGDSSLLWRQ